MTLSARLTETHARAARLYLQRQDLELQRQHLTATIAQCEQAMLKTDGEVDVLTALLAAEKGGGDGV